MLRRTHALSSLEKLGVCPTSIANLNIINFLIKQNGKNLSKHTFVGLPVKMAEYVNVVLAPFHDHIKITTEVQNDHDDNHLKFS